MNTHLHLLIDIARQEMLVLDEQDSIVRQYTVSTGKAGIGSVNGSGCTPTGNFLIAEKIGQGEPLNTIYQSRRPCGSFPDRLPEGTTNSSDFILTGILWLNGLDADNANTHERYIYIHGTHQTHLLGHPASHGCIRLAPEHLAELMSLVETGTSVTIH
ncbi:MAG: L,D-transpeptidase [Akkermansia sp.]